MAGEGLSAGMEAHNHVTSCPGPLVRLTLMLIDCDGSSTKLDAMNL